MLLVEIFVGKAELVARDAADLVLDVGLGGGELLQLALDSIHGKVLARSEEEDLLEALEQLTSHLTRKSIIVFVTHMHHELPVIIRRGFGHAQNVLDLDAALEFYTYQFSDSFISLTGLLHIADFICGQEELPLLSHAPLVVLDDLAGENHSFALLEIGHHSRLVTQVEVIMADRQDFVVFLTFSLRAGFDHPIIE